MPPAGPTIHQPVHTDVPQLLFSGQFDSFSPFPAVEVAVKTFGNAWVLEIPGQTHNALGFSDCPIGIRNEWIRSPTSPPTATTCLKDMGIVFQTRGA